MLFPASRQGGQSEILNIPTLQVHSQGFEDILKITGSFVCILWLCSWNLWRMGRAEHNANWKKSQMNSDRGEWYSNHIQRYLDFLSMQQSKLNYLAGIFVLVPIYPSSYLPIYSLNQHLRLSGSLELCLERIWRLPVLVKLFFEINAILWAQSSSSNLQRHSTEICPNSMFYFS